MKIIQKESADFKKYKKGELVLLPGGQNEYTVLKQLNEQDLEDIKQLKELEKYA